VLTAEFKLSLLRSTRATRLVCRADVVKAGSHLMFAESSVEADENGERTLIARASVTLAVLREGRS
jgi:acyl-coenzyme A thioesterase PaaI-like protein